jgi:membrane protein required for colicin V production
MNFFDWILIILFGLGAFWGFKSGLITGALTVASLYVAGLVSSQFAERVVGIISQNIESESISTALAYVIIYVGIFLVGRIVAKLIISMLNVVLMGWLDKLGGAALGLVAGLLIIGAVVGAGARFAYPLEGTVKEYEGDAMTKFAKSIAAEGARGAVSISLEESEVTNVVVDIYNILPGGALGLVPGDFGLAFKVLNERISIEEE